MREFQRDLAEIKEVIKTQITPTTKSESESPTWTDAINEKNNASRTVSPTKTNEHIQAVKAIIEAQKHEHRLQQQRHKTSNEVILTTNNTETRELLRDEGYEEISWQLREAIYKHRRSTQESTSTTRVI
jgi:hypothetical protein